MASKSYYSGKGKYSLLSVEMIQVTNNFQFVQHSLILAQEVAKQKSVTCMPSWLFPQCVWSKESMCTHVLDDTTCSAHLMYLTHAWLVGSDALAGMACEIWQRYLYGTVFVFQTKSIVSEWTLWKKPFLSLKNIYFLGIWVCQKHFI